MRSAFFLLLILPTISGFAQDRHALLIGAADYEAHTRWLDLASGEDVVLMKHALLRQGFPEHNIQLVLDPTKEDLVQALKGWPKGLAAGDVAYLHFSGHGQAVVDLDGDEPSGYDQSLVPVNAGKIPGVDGYYGQHHLVDDEFALLLTDIRRVLGPEGQLICALDACHSGSATRAPATQRGAGFPMMMKPGPPPSLADRMSMEESWLDEPTEPHLAPLVAFFGCASSELNSECVMTTDGAIGIQKKVGSLSYALSSAFERIDGASASWGDVFRLVRSQMGRMVPNQTPGMEGDPGLGLFNGLGRPTRLDLTLMAVDGKTVQIQGGHLMGVRRGATMRLVDVEREGASVLAEVKAVGPTTCTAEAAEAGFAPTSLDAVAISMLTPGFEHVTMTYCCPACTGRERKAVKAAFKAERWLVHEPDTALAEATLHAVTGGWLWQNRAGTPILEWNGSLDSNLSPDRWKSVLFRAAQLQQLVELDMASDALDASLIMKVGSVADIQSRSANTQESKNENLIIRIVDGPQQDSTNLVCFSLENTTREKLHFTLLLVDNGEVIHMNQQQAFERKLGGLEQGGTSCWQFNGFNGDDRNAVIKVFLSNQPIAFEAPFVETSLGSRSVPHQALAMFAPPGTEVEENGSRNVGPLEVEVMTVPIRILNN